MKRRFIVPVFIGGAGCPAAEKCIFCDQAATGGDPAGPSEAGEFIAKYISNAPCGSLVEIAFYGGTFTALPPAARDAYFDAARLALSGSANALSAAGSSFAGFRISTRPDFIDASVLGHLKERGVTVIELGIESFDDGVLAASRRGYSGALAGSSARLVKSSGFALSLHLMCGLPGQTREVFFSDVARAIAAGPDYARIHPLCVIEGTPAEKILAASGEKTFLPDDEAVAQTAYAVAAFELAGVRVIRVGLLESEKFRARVAAGPAFPNLREVAESRIHSVVFAMLRRLSPENKRFTAETASERVVNFVSGYKRENIKKNKDIVLEFKNKMLYNNFRPSDQYIHFSCTGPESFDAVFTREDILREYINSIKR